MMTTNGVHALLAAQVVWEKQGERGVLVEEESLDPVSEGEMDAEGAQVAPVE